MVSESSVIKHKCKLCKGTVCIHTHLANAERKKEKMNLPSVTVANQGMQILDKLLKENSPEEILKLGAREELVSRVTTMAPDLRLNVSTQHVLNIAS